MIFVLGFAVVIGVVLIALAVWIINSTNYELVPVIMMVAGMAAVIVSGAMFIAYGMASVSAPVKAKLLNESYGTSYTAEDLVFGDDIIMEVIQGKRSRLDVTVENRK